MRVAIAVTQTSLLRHFVEALEELSDRGHEAVVLASEHGQKTGLPDRLAGVRGVDLRVAPPWRSDEWERPAAFLRVTFDYLRYFDRSFRGATKLRARALRKLLQIASGDARTHVWVKCPDCGARKVDEKAVELFMDGGGTKDLIRNVMRVFRLAERAMPADPAITKFLHRLRPDVLLVTPLVSFGGRQADYVKSARTLGIPTVFPVFSWDNLTTKGLIHEVPDQTVVWNDVQRQELVSLHGVPDETIRVVGAPRFDTFFSLHPRQTYQEFCERRGLSPERPTVTYLCSSDFVARNEQGFVDTWTEALRTHADLADVNVIVRPHPRTARGWADWPGRERPGVHLDRKTPAGFTDEEGLFEVLHHSRAAVGLNTSAELEAGIAGRPVFTLKVPGFEGGQEQAPHFSYLLEPNGGFVRVAGALEEHLAQLAAELSRRLDRAPIDAFIEGFVRPRGLGRPVAPIFADAVEEAARLAQDEADAVVGHDERTPGRAADR